MHDKSTDIILATVTRNACDAELEKFGEEIFVTMKERDIEIGCTVGKAEGTLDGLDVGLCMGCVLGCEVGLICG